MSTITYYLRKIDGKVCDRNVITQENITLMSEDQILFIENYVHKTHYQMVYRKNIIIHMYIMVEKKK